MTDGNNNLRQACRSDEEQRRLLDQITTLFEHKITFNEYVGFKVQRLQPAPVQIAFQMRPDLVGHYQHGRLHGGVISAVLDATGGLAVMQGIADYHANESSVKIMSRFSPLATIDMRVDYLRQGIGQQFLAEANLVRLGRRVAVCSMSLFNEERTLIATGNASYIVS